MECFGEPPHWSKKNLMEHELKRCDVICVFEAPWYLTLYRKDSKNAEKLIKYRYLILNIDIIYPNSTGQIKKLARPHTHNLPMCVLTSLKKNVSKNLCF